MATFRKCRFRIIKSFTRQYYDPKLKEEYDKIPEGTGYKARGGTGYDGFYNNHKNYQQEVDEYGYFHKYGIDSTNDGHYSVAIVEDKDGCIHMVYPEKLTFLSDEVDNEQFQSHKRIFGF